jgi:ankyrin repeat protein
MPARDPVTAFIEAATAPREGHASGTLEHAEMIRARYPDVARGNIYVAALLADEVTVRAVLDRDAVAATAKGGPFEWDALTYLCFSRYLRLDAGRSDAFVRTARALLDAGGSARTGWYETIDHPNPRPVFESAIYGAAGVAHHADLTRLLLERGADPNDEETPYHVPETTDNTVMRILLENGRLNADSLTTMLLRKADWHDLDGLRLLLEHGANPNRMQPWGRSALHQAVRRDNSIAMIELLLEHGADPWLPDTREGRSAAAMAAHRGRRAVLALFQQRGTSALPAGDRLIAACALDEREAMRTLMANEPALRSELVAQGGTLLAEFAGVGNTAGVRNLLDCGVSPVARYEGDGYFGIAGDSTALHVAAWRAWPDVVKELIARGTPVNARDGKGRTALALAVKACVDSFWTDRRSPESVNALLDAGASVADVEIPSGYDEVDVLLRRHAEGQAQ